MYILSLENLMHFYKVFVHIVKYVTAAIKL